MQEKFVITNTTVKPPRINPKTKQDARSLSEKNGYSVSYRDKNDQVVLIRANEFKVVTEVPDSVWGLEGEGLVSIKKLKDVSDALKEHTFRRERRGAKPASEERSDETQPEVEAESNRKRLAKAVEMGQDAHRGANFPEDGAVNPDGPPNFVAIAPSSETRKRGKRRA